MTLFAFLSPATDRAILIAVVGGCYLGYHLYHLWHGWQAKRDKEKARGEEKIKRIGQGQGEVVVNSGRKEESLHSPTTNSNASTTPTNNDNAPVPGEAEYAQARGMPHQPIPDCEYDGEYLKLLAKSAELGYARAMAKLGDYAMRRACMVEAYYWFSMAKKNGMQNLDRTLLQVRSVWASGGFRRESMNEYEGFTYEQGTIGYALLCIDARHNVEAAKARLAECAPEFLVKP